MKKVSFDKYYDLVIIDELVDVKNPKKYLLQKYGRDIPDKYLVTKHRNIHAFERKAGVKTKMLQ